MHGTLCLSDQLWILSVWSCVCLAIASVCFWRYRKIDQSIRVRRVMHIATEDDLFCIRMIRLSYRCQTMGTVALMCSIVSVVIVIVWFFSFFW
jgi:hypothetical protein